MNKPGKMSFLSEIGRIPGPQYLPRWHMAHRRKNKRDILAAPAPSNKSELKSFLGLMTYNAKFLPRLSTVLHPLYDLLRKDTKWSWSREHDSAVCQAKKLVSEATTLTLTNQTRSTVMRHL